MSAPFEYAMKHADQQKDIIRKEFLHTKLLNSQVFYCVPYQAGGFFLIVCFKIFY